MKDSYTASGIDLMDVLDAVETVEAELEQLEYDEEWYSSDSRDKLMTAKEILHGILEIREPEAYEDEDFEQGTLALC